MTTNNGNNEGGKVLDMVSRSEGAQQVAGERHEDQAIALGNEELDHSESGATNPVDAVYQHEVDSHTPQSPKGRVRYGRLALVGLAVTIPGVALDAASGHPVEHATNAVVNHFKGETSEQRLQDFLNKVNKNPGQFEEVLPDGSAENTANELAPHDKDHRTDIESDLALQQTGERENTVLGDGPKVVEKADVDVKPANVIPIEAPLTPQDVQQ